MIVDESRDEPAAAVVAQHPGFGAVRDDQHLAAARRLDGDGAGAPPLAGIEPVGLGGLARSAASEHDVPAVGRRASSASLIGGSRARRAARAACSTARSTVAGVEVVEAAQVLERALAREARAALELERDDGRRIRQRRRELRRRRAVDRDDGRAGRGRDVQQARVVADGRRPPPRADRRRPRASSRRRDCGRAGCAARAATSSPIARSFAEPSTTTSAPSPASARGELAEVRRGPALRRAVLRARHQRDEPRARPAGRAPPQALEVARIAAQPRPQRRGQRARDSARRAPGRARRTASRFDRAADRAGARR